MIAESLRKGGRLIYVGTGTSGRIAALDAAECPPTFNTDPKTVQFIIAGGPKALGAAVEANEDSAALGESEIARRKPGKNDVVIGIAASGRTPFTIAAVRYARRKGAKTIAVVCNPNSELEKAAHVGIVVETGPEVISGSTRMKAGTAQKMVLNMLSSGAFARMGYVYGNLMVNVRPKNHKLAVRAVRILERAANIPQAKARNGAGGFRLECSRSAGHVGSWSRPKRGRECAGIRTRKCARGNRSRTAWRNRVLKGRALSIIPCLPQEESFPARIKAG